MHMYICVMYIYIYIYIQAYTIICITYACIVYCAKMPQVPRPILTSSVSSFAMRSRRGQWSLPKLDHLRHGKDGLI